MSSRPQAVVRQTCTVSEQFHAVGTTPARHTYQETGRESPRDRIVTSLCRCEAIDEGLLSSMVALQPRAWNAMTEEHKCELINFLKNLYERISHNFRCESAHSARMSLSVTSKNSSGGSSVSIAIGLTSSRWYTTVSRLHAWNSSSLTSLISFEYKFWPRVASGNYKVDW